MNSSPLAGLFDPLLERLARLERAQKLIPTLMYGKVTQADPLRVRLDGDREALAGTPHTIGVCEEGQRVLCVKQGTALYVLGSGAQARATLAAIGEAGQAVEDQFQAIEAALLEVETVDGRVDDAQAGAEAALAEAVKAVETADGRNRIWAGMTQPVEDPEQPFVQGDLWYVTDVEGRMVMVKIWNGTDWNGYQFVADSILVPGSVGPTVIKDGSIVTQKLAATAIDGMTVTGAILRTAASGQRMQFDINGLRAFNAAGAVTGSLAADSGGLSLSGTLTSYAGGNTPRAQLSGGELAFDLPGSPGAAKATYGPGYITVTGTEARFQIMNEAGGENAGVDVFAGKNGDIRLYGKTIMYGNSFALKSQLEAWTDAPDGTHAWVLSERREYVRVAGVWRALADVSNDTDWVTLPLSSGWVSPSGWALRYRVKQGFLQFNGRIQRSNGAAIGVAWSQITAANTPLAELAKDVINVSKGTVLAHGTLGALVINVNGSISIAGDGTLFAANADFLL